MDTPQKPKWWEKKERPRYEREERNFAKDSSLRQTISSGRFGVHKGDSESPRSGGVEGFLFTVDNKGTKHHTYSIDIRYWRALRKRAEMVGRTPALAVTFYPTADDRGYRTPEQSTQELVVITRDTWDAMKDVIRDKANKGRSNPRPRDAKTKRS